MITPVTDEDLERLSTAEDRDACTGGMQDRIDAVIAELRALRAVADAAAMVHGAEEREDGDTLALAMAGLGIALRDAGRLP